MSANTAITVHKRITLAELLASVETAARPPARRREIAQVIRNDLALMQELFDATAIEARLRDMLVERSQPEVSIKLPDAGPRPLQIVPEYVRARPLVPSRAQLEARRDTEKRSAAIVLLIDGVDLPLWSVGCVRTAAIRKGKESRILTRLAGELHDKDASDLVGEIYSRDVLAHMVAENV